MNTFIPIYALNHVVSCNRVSTHFATPSSNSIHINPLGFHLRLEGATQQIDNKQGWELAIEKLANVTFDRIQRLETKSKMLANSNCNFGSSNRTDSRSNSLAWSRKFTK